MPDIFEDEWMKFKFIEQAEIDKLIQDPLMLLADLSYVPGGKKLPP